ncbi:hypothetical protein GJV85_08355 [Sulfurimonas aquatica]|uniref:Uncharacterized protein n=1 Tax=Sulfurimonas aquatica TaxID=2672570 RepID=A0A975B0S6_9BACT|nr:hypothetical protein [Sulfurimonas aquatica]QSZ42122.1 hypothetical protein GJV85_08355 [Sulfurimonas aquatica]
MTYIAGLVVIALFFLALHYFTELNHMEKINVTIIVLSILAIIVMYNEYSQSQNEKMMDATLRFDQNKTIQCDGVDINKTNYTLSVGTYTFIGKENTPNYNKMISASTCE